MVMSTVVSSSNLLDGVLSLHDQHVQPVANVGGNHYTMVDRRQPSRQIKMGYRQLDNRQIVMMGMMVDRQLHKPIIRANQTMMGQQQLKEPIKVVDQLQRKQLTLKVVMI